MLSWRRGQADNWLTSQISGKQWGPKIHPLLEIFEIATHHAKKQIKTFGRTDLTIIRLITSTHLCSFIHSSGTRRRISDKCPSDLNFAVQTEAQMQQTQQGYFPLNILVQFCSLTLHSRALHIGGVPLGLKTTGLLLLRALRLPLLTAGSLAKSRQAGESCAMFPPGSDRAAL